MKFTAMATLPISRRAFLGRAAGLTVAGAFAATGLGVATNRAARAEAGIFPGMTVFVDTDALNLRTDAALASDVIATYPYGTTATIIDKSVDNYDDNLTWVPVEISGTAITGWFAFEYLTVTDGGGNEGGGFTIVDGPLNLRGAAGLDADILGTYPTGATGVAITQESVQADDYMWALMRMDADGQEGWLALDFVSFDVGGGGGSNRDRFTIIDGPLNLRDGAGLDAPVVATYPTGAGGIVTGTGRRVTRDGYDWVNVQMDDGNEGMVAIDFIAIE